MSLVHCDRRPCVSRRRGVIPSAVKVLLKYTFIRLIEQVLDRRIAWFYVSCSPLEPLSVLACLHSTGPIVRWARGLVVVIRVLASGHILHDPHDQSRM
jgi:hypothetical protein